MPTPVNVIPEFHLHLRALRQRSCLSQQELAELIGVGERTLRAWESGETRPSARGLRLTAAVLGVRAGALIEASPGRPRSPAIA